MKIYSEWKIFFDGNTEMKTKFMRAALNRRVVENTTIVTACIFYPEGMKQTFFGSYMDKCLKAMGV